MRDSARGGADLFAAHLRIAMIAIISRSLVAPEAQMGSQLHRAFQEHQPQAVWKSRARSSMLCRGGVSSGAPGSAKVVCGENRAVPSRALS